MCWSLVAVKQALRAAGPHCLQRLWCFCPPLPANVTLQSKHSGGDINHPWAQELIKENHRYVYQWQPWGGLKDQLLSAHIQQTRER